MKNIWLLVILLPTFIWAHFLNDSEVQEARRKAIKYGLDENLVPLVEKMQEEKETCYDDLLLERLRSTRDKDLKAAIFNLFAETKNRKAKDIALKFINEEANSTRISIITNALSYLTTVMPNDSKVKDLLWDIIANTAQPDRTRLVAIALQFWAKTGDRTKGSELIRLYKSADYPNDPKTTILWLLGEMKEFSALSLLKEIASNDAEDDFRRAAAISAQANIQGESSLSEILPYLSDPSQQVRLSVIGSVVGFDSSRALRIVENALRDNDANIRIKALVALGNKKDTRAVKAIAYRIENEDNENVQLSALKALIEIDNYEARKIIGEVFVSSRYSEEIRLQALSAILKSSPDSLPPLLTRAIQKENINYPSKFLIGLAGRMSSERGNYEDFYRSLSKSSSASIRSLAQDGAKLNNASL